MVFCVWCKVLGIVFDGGVVFKVGVIRDEKVRLVSVFVFFLCFSDCCSNVIVFLMLFLVFVYICGKV